MKDQSDKVFDLWLASQLPVGRALPVHIYFSLEERRMAKNGFEAGKELQATRITELEAQLADAKQVANDCRIVTDNAIAEAQGARKDAERHQLQLIEKDSNGVFRFKANKVVEHLLDFATPKGCGMNELARKNFSAEDRMQFAQLIGYSLDGYCSLSYVTDESYELACQNKP